MVPGRPPDKGPLTFHEGTELRFLEAMRKAVTEPGTRGQPGTDDDAERILEAADRFCWDEQWMMIMGDEKGLVLDDAVRERLEVVRGQRHEDYFTALELGTYVGYSTVRIARLLPAGARLYTCDPHGGVRQVAREVLELAGLSARVGFMAGSAQECIQQLKSWTQPLDLVFIDHEKSDYLPALRSLEKAGLLSRGAAVVADNVDVFRMDEYLDYVRNSGRYQSRHVDAALECTPTGKDGAPEVADGVEVSLYLAPEGAGAEL